MAARYTVKFVAGERRGSLLVLLPPTQPCSALVQAVKEPDGPELYAADTLSDVLPGAKETAVVVLKVSCFFTFALSRDSGGLCSVPWPLTRK